MRLASVRAAMHAAAEHASCLTGSGPSSVATHQWRIIAAAAWRKPAQEAGGAEPAMRAITGDMHVLVAL